MNPVKLERRSKAIKTQAELTAAAPHNEELTRKRVDGLEVWAEGISKLLARGFWGRLKWLCLGK